MTMPHRLLRRLRSDRAGAVLIETAIVGPVVILMSVGAFEVSRLVARNSELVGAIAEAQSMVLATDPDTQEKRDQLKDLIADSAHVSPDGIVVEPKFRCGSATAYVASFNDCASGDRVSSLVRIEISDTLVPLWTKFGVAAPMHYRLDRYIMYKQATKS